MTTPAARIKTASILIVLGTGLLIRAIWPALEQAARISQGKSSWLIGLNLIRCVAGYAVDGDTLFALMLIAAGLIAIWDARRKMKAQESSKAVR